MLNPSPQSNPESPLSKIARLIQENEKELVDAVESEGAVPIPSPGTVDGKIVDKLNEIFPLRHSDPGGQTTTGQIDKLHVLWASALKDALWLAWLSEAKKDRGVLTQEICNNIDDSLKIVLGIGRMYAKSRT